ncbi:MAG: Adaptive-response sensory-kinase SasA [Anaerolineae bacterium]|nr:Adaptive-response sensory-kinase SasA [Anaerolineae bacterium]
MTHKAHILIIDPVDNPDLRVGLQYKYGFVVDYSTGGKNVLAAINRANPDVIVLNARLVEPSAHALLAQLTDSKASTPVVLVGSNGDIATTDFRYPHIAGWLSQNFTPAELALLIQTALDRALPASDLVLTKRAELVESNQRLARRVQELQTLFEIGKSVASQLDLETVLRRVAKAVVDLTGADESYLLLVDETEGDLYLRAEANLGEEDAKNFRIKAKDSISGQVVQTGQPITLTTDSAVLKVKTGLSVYSLVNVPLRAGQTVIGVLGANNRRQQRAFTGDDELLLSALADWAAIAIQNARLYDKIVQSARDLQLVNEVSQLVSGTLDVQQIPRLLLQRIAELVGAECGSLALLDQERGGVVFLLAYDAQGQELTDMTGLLMPRNQGIVGVVANTGQPVIANDVTKHPAWSPMPDNLTGFKTKKLIAVPLLAKGETVGVMELLNKDGDFTDKDVQLLTLVASSTAIAIQNARQYAAIKQANQALREAQEQRIAAERWAVLGKAAATLAHRINNSTALVPIAAQHTRELLEQAQLPDELRRDIEGNLERIERNSLYTVDLAEILLRRFRKNPTEAHNVNELIQQAVSVLDVPDNVSLILNLDPHLPEADTSDLLVDVFVELISNSIRAIGSREGLIRVATFKAGKGQVSAQITDNGPGIPAENMAKIFDMFFTTTPSGLGFGLWWVKTYLEQQHGDITVHSAPFQDTTFTITLPGNPLSLQTL